MPGKAILWVKGVVHVVCALPFLVLVWSYRDGSLGAQADPVNYITHFTGDWALWILLVDLGITPVRRLSSSLGWLIRFRRMVGLWAFFYASLHLLTYVILFSGYDMPTALAGLRAGHLAEPWRQLVVIWPAMWDDLLKRRFIQVGFAAWVILLVLAVTSPARVMRAMGGKVWARVHWGIYLAAGLAVVHYWWLVKTGVLRPWKDTAVLGVLLGARLVWWGMNRWRGRRLATAAAA